MAVGEVVRSARPEWTEYALAGALAEALWGRGIRPLLLLVAGEGRLFRHRHPLPKGKPLGRAFMAVVCAERGLGGEPHPDGELRPRGGGGPVPEGLGGGGGGPFGFPAWGHLGGVRGAPGAYARVGFPLAWEEHHQGAWGLSVPGGRRHAGASFGAGGGDGFGLEPEPFGGQGGGHVSPHGGGLLNLTEDPFWPMVEVEGRKRPDLWREGG